MDEELQIDYVEQPEWQVIGGGIRDHNIEQAGPDHHQNLCFVVRGADQEIVAGVIGATHWQWLHLDLLWVKEELRQRGYGRRLVELAEEEARKRGAQNVYLDTFSFQALEFYKKCGYHVFGELRDFPPGHQRYYMTKRL